MRRFLPILLALPLAACGPSNEPAAPQPKITVRSNGQDALHKLDPLNLAIGLKRAVLDSGQDCKRVTKTGYVGEYKNMSYWTATCEDKAGRTRDWALFVGADETVQVRLCDDVAKVGLPACVGRMDQSKPADINEASAPKAADKPS
jgi:hypothetical protein